ncbi:aminotransferase class I/II-fold pyridoxal phosphate-dependent enzyme, partial [Serratia marcescens]|nr:aminotransferase class I/II-fold pyridoxal phosphate-dependent enzyme [Serratia marcescens]
MKRKPLPGFLNNRINERFQERFHTEWQGTHLFKINQNGVNDVILCTNDYLCLCDEESLNVGNHENRMGEKIMSSVFLNETSYQAEVERAFSEFFGSEDSIMCQSGYAANTGLIQAIANENVPIYIDILAHMSLHDGVRLANAKSYAFAHNSVEGARKKIASYGPGVIVVDSVYSTNGSLCPLEDFVALAEETGCVIVVDESHSVGTHGPEGRGIVYALGLTKR